MSKLLKYLFPLLFFIPAFAVAQSTNTWFLSGGNLRPNLSTWGLQIPALANQSCLGTNSTGVFIAGTCSGGGGSSTFGTSSLSAVLPLVYTQSSSLAQFSTLFGTTTTWGLGNNGFIGVGATGIPYKFSTSSITTLSGLSLPYSQLTGTPTIASSTLLGDTNQFSGTDKFTNPITIATLNGLIAGNSGLTYASATTSASCSGTVSCSGFTILGSSPVTITGAAGTTASSTLLGDTNTWSGTNTFNNTITGSITGNAGTATKLITARAINGVNFDGTGPITIFAASSTLLGDANTFSGVDSFTNASSNFSGTWQTFSPAHFLTANQTVTLSGDVSGSGSTAITTAIGAHKVTVGMLTQATANTVLGNPTGATADIQAIATSSLFQNSSATLSGLLTSTDWNTFNGKQAALTLTTIGSSGAATLIGATLNIPQYTGGATSKKTFTYVVASSGGDFTTIQGAMDACGVTGGDIILTDTAYAQGSTGLRWKGSNCSIWGHGPGTTTISFTGATTLFKTNTPASGFTHNELHKLLITADGNTSGVAIDWSDMDHGLVDNIQTSGVGTSLRLNDTQNITFYNVFSNLDFNDNRAFCVNASSTNPTNANTFSDIFCGAPSGGGVGFQLTNSNGNTFDNIRVEPASVTGTTGLKIFDDTSTGAGGVWNNVFTNWYVESNGVGVSIANDAGGVNSNGIKRNTFKNFINESNTTDWSVTDTVIAQNDFEQSMDSNFFNPITSFQGPVGISTSTTLGNINNLAYAFFGISPQAGVAMNQFVIGSSTQTSLRLDNGGNLFLAKAPTFQSISGSTQCLHVSSAGLVSGTGSDCGAGGGSVTGTTGQVAYLSGTNTAVGTSSLNISTNGQITNKNGDVLSEQASYIVSTTTTTGNFTDVQSAINALPSTGGKIFVRCGTYTLPTAQVGIQPKVSFTLIQGSGTCTQFNFDKANTPNAYEAAVGGLQGLVIQDVYFHQTNGTFGGIGINASNTPLFIASQVKIDGTATSVQIKDTQNLSFYQDYKNLDLRDNTSCVELNGLPVNDNTFENLRCANHAGNNGYALYLDSSSSNGAQNNTFINFDAEPTGAGTGITAIYANNAVDNQFYTSYVEANAVGWNFTSNSLRNTFHGGEFVSNTTYTNNGNSNQWLGTDRESKVFSQIVSSTTIQSIGTADAVVPMLFLTNNNSFAQSGDFLKITAINGSDSANGINITYPGTGAGLRIQGTGATAAASTTGKWFMQGLGAASASGVVLCRNSTTGEVILGNGATTCAPSSIDFKRDVVSSNLGLDTLMRLRPVTFFYKENGEAQIGLIAQEVQKVDPRLVDYNTDGSVATINWGDVDALLIKAVQDLANKTPAAQRSAEENWQWFVMALFLGYVVYNEYDKRKK